MYSYCRLSLRLFVKTLLAIQQTKESLGSLPLGNVLANTVQYEKCGCQNNPSLVLASKLRSTWQYNVPHAGRNLNLFPGPFLCSHPYLPHPYLPHPYLPHPYLPHPMHNINIKQICVQLKSMIHDK